MGRGIALPTVSLTGLPRPFKRCDIYRLPNGKSLDGESLGEDQIAHFYFSLVINGLEKALRWSFP